MGTSIVNQELQNVTWMGVANSKVGTGIFENKLVQVCSKHISAIEINEIAMFCKYEHIRTNSIYIPNVVSKPPKSRVSCALMVATSRLACVGNAGMASIGIVCTSV